MTTTSITKQFLESRLDSSLEDELKTGVWYSGFSKAYNYAMEKHIPFVGVWSNGDACSFCKRLEKCFMSETFKNWMKDSDCIFWFGCSLDKTDDDKTYGKGFYWGWDNKTVKTYPFMRFYWSKGQNEVNSSAPGNSWDLSKDGDAGAQNVIDQLNSLLDDVHSYDLASTPSLRIRTNPDWSLEEVEEFRQSIKDNDGYCPCVPEHTDDSKCMCKWFREKTTEGTCHCGLYDKYF